MEIEGHVTWDPVRPLPSSLLLVTSEERDVGTYRVGEVFS